MQQVWYLPHRFIIFRSTENCLNQDDAMFLLRILCLFFVNNFDTFSLEIAEITKQMLFSSFHLVLHFLYLLLNDDSRLNCLHQLTCYFFSDVHLNKEEINRFITNMIVKEMIKILNLLLVILNKGKSEKIRKVLFNTGILKTEIAS